MRFLKDHFLPLMVLGDERMAAKAKSKRLPGLLGWLCGRHRLDVRGGLLDLLNR